MIHIKSNNQLLQKELNRYKKNLTFTKYNKDLFPNLFKKFKYYGMVEDSYCCYGKEFCCWQEVVEEGVWDATLGMVKRNILDNIHYIQKYLYNPRKYGKRLYMYEDKNCCEIYIYTRDLIKEDFAIWFNKEDI